MDNCSTQSYLHKKFKKLQTSTVSNHHHQPLQQPQPQQNAVPFNDRISPPTVQNHERQPDIYENVPQHQIIDKTLNDSDVPIHFSTNLRQTSSTLDSHYYDESHEPHIKRTKDDHESLTPTVKNETSPPLQVANRTSSTLDNHYYEDLSEANRKSAKDGEESADKIETSQPEKPGGKYVCNYCNLVCSKPSVLQKHIRAHTNERPFPCTSCGFSFKTRSNLYKHCRSRTHANRVMGNKAQEISNDTEVEKQEQVREPPAIEMTKTPIDMKQKPYKPRFKAFFDSSIPENGESCEPPPVDPHRNLTTNVELISLHIDDLIHKNNSIMVNTNDPNMYKKRSVPENPSQPEVITNNNHQECGYRYQDLYEPHVDQRSDDEPLNLTNKNRKRCVSEIQEPTTQKSLIKELLLKNLYADANKQCPHCKMIFQTVTELDLHKYRNCKGYTKSGARYSRSSSVNVASILTQNKNAFDTNPHIPNAVFPLKSPGPFLGKTRLVESDKTKSFSFDDGIQPITLRSSSNSAQDLMRTSQRYALSPLTLQSDKYKRPVKLFGGELVTESRPRKPDTKEDKYGRYVNTSENRVVKSALQSGGTLSEAISTSYKREVKPPSPEIIRVYDSPTTSPTIDVVNIDKPISYERPEVIVDYSRPARPEGVNPYKYTNIMDYSQNAARRLTPKITQPTITLASLSQKSAVQPRYTAKHDRVFDKIEMPVFPKDMDGERRASENIDFAQKQILLQQKMTSEPPKIQIPYTPVNVLVNGKVIRYVPGMPGPITADTPLDMAYSSNIVTTPPAPTARLPNSRLPKPNIRITPAEAPPKYHASPTFSDRSHAERSSYIERTQPEINRSPKMSTLEIKTDLAPRITEMRSPAGDMKSPKLPESKSPIKSPSLSAIGEPPRKFARPNSLALKPAVSGSLKQHHGLTPTMFNQILISPDTPRVAKKYNHQILHGNYFSYLGLKSSTKSSYCTLNKTQPFYVPHFKKLSMYSEWRQHSGTKMDKMFASGYDPRPHGKYKYTIAKPDAEEDTILHTTYKFNVSEQPSSKEEPTKILGGYESNEDYTYVRGRGRGRFVCDQCGIRCKKPSMLKKHIRTHSNGRPYTCSHCNFSGGKMCLSSFCSFKTKGNLTKHMKSKAHNKNYTACSTNSNSSNSPPDQSGSPSSESESDDSSMDSSEHSPKTYDSDDSSNRAGPTTNDENQHYNNSSNYSEQNSMDSPNKYKQSEYDNSAMEILADIATKQEKLEKNSVAKNVASEFLKLATKNDQNSDGYMSSGKVVNDLIVESEENKSCNICSKTFIKPSLLRMHMNVHYIERPFRCDLCSISFRTKGHFQKHERSAGHKNKLLSSPNLSSSEPRPFKCTDCAIAFRIHGHLAKHLRSKMHIMKLECLNKIPFGVYAELERSNSLLTEINTADGDQCLESLRKLAKKVFTNDPSKLNQMGPTISEAAVETDS